MRTTWLVMRHAISTTLRKRSFWLFTFLMPAILLAFNLYALFQDEIGGDAGTEGAAAATAAEQAPPIVALVDEAGIIQRLPDGVPAGMFARYDSQQAALDAMESGAVSQVLYLPPDYLASGEVTVFARSFQLTQGENTGVAIGSNQEWLLNYILVANLAGDEMLASAVFNPTPGQMATRHALATPEEPAGGDETLALLVASVIPYVYYFILIISAGYMMQSVTAEKENRTVEVLLTSLNPRQMMVGKILGMSVVVMIQLLVWAGAAVLALNQAGPTLDLGQFQFPPGFLVWSALFLILGYLLYASVMAAAGAIAPTAREAGQVTWLLVVPLLPTLMFGREFVDNPDGSLSLALSLFPFSAPSGMVTRLAVAPVPLWQILLSLALLAATAYLFVVLSARFFRADNLLSDAAFHWKRLIGGWRGAS